MKQIVGIIFSVLILMPVSTCTGDNLIKNAGFESLNKERNFPLSWNSQVPEAARYEVKSDWMFCVEGQTCIKVQQQGEHAFATLRSETPLPLKTTRDYTVILKAKGKGKILICIDPHAQNGLDLKIVQRDWMDVDSSEWKEFKAQLNVPGTLCPLSGQSTSIKEVKCAEVVIRVTGTVWFDDVFVGEGRLQKKDATSMTLSAVSPLITIPKAKNPPIIDGVVGADEWRYCASITGFRELNDNRMAKRQCRVYLTYDANSLYVAVDSVASAEALGMGKAGKQVDLGMADDYIETFIQIPAGRWYQLIVNPAGGTWEAAYPSKANLPGSWECKSSVRMSSETVSGVLTTDKKIWTAELRIPFKSLDAPSPRPGETWRMNFCRDYSVPAGSRKADDWTSWSFCNGNFGTPETFGYVKFGEDVPAIRWTEPSDPSSGNIKSLVKVNAATPKRILHSLFVVPRDQKHRVIVQQTQSVEITPGREAQSTIADNLYLQGQNGLIFYALVCDTQNNVLSQYDLPFTGLASFRMKFFPVWSKGELVAALDAENVSNLPPAFKGKIEVYPAGMEDKSLLTYELPFKQGALRKDVRVDISKLPPGPYSIKGMLHDATGHVLASSVEPLVIPKKPVWAKNNIVISEKVLPPWFPVKVNKNQVEVTERRHTIAGSGLPEQLVIKGNNLLSQPAAIRAVVQGKEVSFSFAMPKAIKQCEQYVVYGLDGKSKLFDYRGQVKVEFDGFSVLSFALTPTSGVTVDNLTLEFSFPAANALYARGEGGRKRVAALYHDQYTNDPNQPAETVIMGEWHYSRRGWIWPEYPTHDIWVGNDNIGLGVMWETFANVRGSQNVEITPQGSNTLLKVHLISTSTTLTSGQALSYQYMYQATPVKPADTDPKHWHFAANVPWQAQVPTMPTDILDRLYIGMGYYLEKTTYSNIINADTIKLKQDREIYHRHNANIVPYFNLSATSIDVSDFKDYGDEWISDPLASFQGPTGKLQSICNNTPYPDYVLYHVKRIYEAGLDGVYLDVSGCTVCRNPHHGCGYQRSTDPERKTTAAILATRELYKRMYTWLKSDGRNGMVFHHCMPTASYAGFVDVVFDSEEWRGEENQRKMTPDMFRSKELKTQMGPPCTFFPANFVQPAHATVDPLTEFLCLALPHHVLVATCEEITPFWDLLDDWWTSARFIGYWHKDMPVKTNQHNVLAGIYVKGQEKKALLVVANWEYKPVKVEIAADWSMLGWDANRVRITDALTKEKLKPLFDASRVEHCKLHKTAYEQVLLDDESERNIENNVKNFSLNIPGRNLKFLFVAMRH